MDKCSYFFNNTALFGSFPSQESVNILEQEGVQYFVNLTYNDEYNILPYQTNYNYISFPIRDLGVPQNLLDFSKFILKLTNIILNLRTSKIYIHCRGGHGRSGVVISCILCQIYNKLTTQQILLLVNKYHNDRETMREKWRVIGSPQTRHQKYFVYKFNEPFIFFKHSETKHSMGFSMFSDFSVTIPNVGEYKNCYDGYEGLRIQQILTYGKIKSKSFFELQNTDYNEDNKYLFDDLEYVIKLKIEQHENIKNALLGTFLRPIIEYRDTYNIIGILLTKIRNNILMQ